MGKNHRDQNPASVNYKSIATDCDIIAQKIESLRKPLEDDKSDKAQEIDIRLYRALNAIQDAKEAAA